MSMLCNIDFHLSPISPVVLQLFPTFAAQSAGSSTPHSVYIENETRYGENEEKI